MAKIHYYENKYAICRDYLIKKVLPKNDKFANGYKLLGDVYRKTHDLEKAILNYEYALSLSPDIVKAKIELAHLYARVGNHHKAVKLYNAVLVTNPEHSYLYKQLGNSYKALGLADYAEECFKYMHVQLPRDQKMTTLGNAQLPPFQQPAAVAAAAAQNPRNLPVQVSQAQVQPHLQAQVQPAGNLESLTSAISDYIKSNQPKGSFTKGGANAGS